MKRNILALFFFISFVFSSLFASKAFAWSTSKESGWTCFPAGTKILMSGGHEKNIEDVQIGDSVMSYDTISKSMKSALVQELDAPVRDHLYKLTFQDGTTLRLTSEHPLYTKQGWKSIDPQKSYDDNPSLAVTQLIIGDSVFNTQGTYTKLISTLYIPGTVQTYNLKKVSAYNNFFADSYLAHNKTNTVDKTDNASDPGYSCPASGCGSQPGEEPITCTPLTCAKYDRTACGLFPQYFSNGCGGYVYCGATAPCAPTPCTKVAVACSTKCGQPQSLITDGCGGSINCPATAVCSRCSPACAIGYTCHIPNECPAGAKCFVAEGTPVCILSKPTAAPTKVMPTPQILCGGPSSSCPAGYTCYQPPYSCQKGAICPAVMESSYCIPLPPTAPPPACALRSQGDANCDQRIDLKDFDIFKSKLNGGISCPYCSANFNADGKIDMIDYEIWRNTFYK